LFVVFKLFKPVGNLVKYLNVASDSFENTRESGNRDSKQAECPTL